MLVNTEYIKTVQYFDTQKIQFVIPSYQRGFRWGTQQVLDLLNDIWEFNQSDPPKDEIYCLQPLIFQKKSNGLDDFYYVIDGQQRLTTIYILLSYIKKLVPAVDIGFSLRYETRPNSQHFLESISEQDSHKKKEVNIDYFFMYSAYESIKKWFDEQPSKGLLAAMKVFERLQEQVCFIWYEIGKQDDPISIFTRINLGKIELTNAELIKALFLRRDNFSRDDEQKSDSIRLKQLEISGEWDRIENALQNDSIWYFLNDGQEYDTRIEFIFDLYIQINGYIKELRNNSINRYASFYVFNDLYIKGVAEGRDKYNIISFLWEEIKSLYYLLNQWFEDPQLYHYIGFLVTTGKQLSDILTDVKHLKKNEVLLKIMKMIQKSVHYEGELLDLTYLQNRAMVKKVLLLFNIETIVQSNSEFRFPFDRYKQEQWDIEHIHAIMSNIPKKTTERKLWLETLKGNQNFKERVDELLSQSTIDEQFFETFYADVLGRYGSSDDIDNITNLALLDSKTNRSYKNAIFPYKREYIISKDKSGRFIPICTKNVFLKYYSKNVSQMNFWSLDDMGDYYEEILSVLSKFLPDTINEEVE